MQICHFSLTFAMKTFGLIVLSFNLYLSNVAFAFFSSKELKIFRVFVQPYGISFKDDLILKVSQNLRKCATFNDTFNHCNSIFVSLTSFTTENELLKLEKLSKSCLSGSYGCLYDKVKSADFQLLKGWFIKVQSSIKNLCKGKCWTSLEQLINSCIQEWVIKESDKGYVQFVLGILQSLCIQDNHLACADKFVNGLLKNSSDVEVCSVTKNLMDNTCLSQCYSDVHKFYDNLGCCAGTVSRFMECNSIQPLSDSYGVFIQESQSRCHLQRPAPCPQDTQIPCLSPPQVIPTKTPSAVSSKGKQIAGICLAVIICVGGAIIVGNFLYQRMKRRAKIQFEDYGYSRLKMLEDEFYFDVEIEDDESK